MPCFALAGFWAPKWNRALVQTQGGPGSHQGGSIEQARAPKSLDQWVPAPYVPLNVGTYAVPSEVLEAQLTTLPCRLRFGTGVWTTKKEVVPCRPRFL